MVSNPNARVIALDVGSKRIGIASANVVARLAVPLTTLEVGENILQDIRALLGEQMANAVVVGLPRGLQGQDTQQTEAVRQFVASLQKVIDIPLFWQDEALTSHKAELELSSKKSHYDKGAVDALAATYILEDFLANHPKGAI